MVWVPAGEAQLGSQDAAESHPGMLMHMDIVSCWRRQAGLAPRAGVAEKAPIVAPIDNFQFVGRRRGLGFLINSLRSLNAKNLLAFYSSQ